MKRRTVLTGLAATAAVGHLGMPSILRAQAPITLNGAVQFNDDHAFTKALTRFEELVKKYYGQPVNFTLHKNSSLGLEKQYFEYMSQGKAVDYGIVSPAHMSTFAKAAPFIDAPFVFKGIEHMNKVVEAGIGVTDMKEADYFEIKDNPWLNTFSPDQVKMLAARNPPIVVERTRKMPLININRVIAEQLGKAPDVLSTDIEGLDYDIIKSLDLSKYRPGCICAETVAMDKNGVNAEITAYLMSQGYVVRGGSMVMFVSTSCPFRNLSTKVLAVVTWLAAAVQCGCPVVKS